MVIEILVVEYNLQNKKTRFLCRTYGSPSFKDKLERDIEEEGQKCPVSLT